MAGRGSLVDAEAPATTLLRARPRRREKRRRLSRAGRGRRLVPAKSMSEQMPATCSQRAPASGDSGEAGIRPLCRGERRPQYVELHCHSAYSFGDGASAPEELAHRAAELGYEALAITDHDGVWGAMEFAQACTAFGVRPIVGAELTVEGSHLTLLVENADGWRNLCRLIT